MTHEPDPVEAEGRSRPDFLPPDDRPAEPEPAPSDSAGPRPEPGAPPPTFEPAEQQPVFAPVLPPGPAPEPVRYAAPTPPPVPPLARPAAPRPPVGMSPVWPTLAILAAAVLVVSAFLPWMRARYSVDLFGERVDTDVGAIAGIDAHDTVLVVPVLALTTALLAGWGLVARDPRICGLAAIPAALALFAAVLFVLRLDRAREELLGGGPPIGSFDVSLAYGWYAAVGAGLLALGLALVQPVAERVSR